MLARSTFVRMSSGKSSGSRGRSGAPTDAAVQSRSAGARSAYGSSIIVVAPQIAICSAGPNAPSHTDCASRRVRRATQEALHLEIELKLSVETGMRPASGTTTWSWTGAAPGSSARRGHAANVGYPAEQFVATVTAQRHGDMRRVNRDHVGRDDRRIRERFVEECATCGRMSSRVCGASTSSWCSVP